MKSVLHILLATCVAALLFGGKYAAAQYQPQASIPLGSLPRAATIPQALPPMQIPPAQIPETWLMLKNGSTFSARMLSAGERVRLRVNEGDIEIRASEIALTGYSLSDLAEQQWALLHQQQLDKQFPFIDWCTRYHLYDIADTALAQMAEKAQDTPRVAGYQVRLKRLREIYQEQQTAAAAQLAAAQQIATPQFTAPLATQQPAPQHTMQPPPLAASQNPAPSLQTATPAYVMPPQVSSTPTTVPNATTTTLPTFLSPAKPLGPTSTAVPALTPSHVQQATYQPLDIPRDQAAAPKEPAINSPNPATLPSAAVELFTARVQPWVVSRCSGCHDSNSTNSFKLERYSKQEAVPRATTLKNLAATTRLVDKNSPAESPLLVMAARAHGTSLTPPVTAGDAAAMAAFREFVALATGRELPKTIKPDPASINPLHGLPGQVTPGRATFPASAADEPVPENKAAAVLNKTEAGWQAAIERQRAYDLEAQRRKDLEANAQHANQVRGLIVDPAVQPAATAEAPVVLTPTPAAAIQQMPATLLREPQPSAIQPSATLPSATLPSAIAIQPNEMTPSVKNPNALPESLLPKSLAAKPKNDLDAYLISDETKPDAALGSSVPPVGQLPSPALPAPPRLPPGASKETPPPVKIDLSKPRRKFPLPPEDTPPPKAVGTGDTKRR